MIMTVTHDIVGLTKDVNITKDDLINQQTLNQALERQGVYFPSMLMRGLYERAVTTYERHENDKRKGSHYEGDFGVDD